VDPLEAVARIGIQVSSLSERRRMEWMVPVEFQLMPVIGNVKGFAAFISSKRIRGFSCMFRPSISIRKTPLANFHAIELLARSGETDRRIPHARIAEDTKALTAGVLDDKEYLEQARTVLPSIGGRSMWSSRSFRRVVLFYFSSLDLNAHVMWRLTDPQSPAYDAALAPQYGSSIEEFYEQIDQVLGECCRRSMRTRRCSCYPIMDLLPTGIRSI